MKEDNDRHYTAVELLRLIVERGEWEVERHDKTILPAVLVGGAMMLLREFGLGSEQKEKIDFFMAMMEALDRRPPEPGSKLERIYNESKQMLKEIGYERGS